MTGVWARSVRGSTDAMASIVQSLARMVGLWRIQLASVRRRSAFLALRPRGSLEEFFLKPRTRFVSLDRAERVGDPRRHRVGRRLAARGGGAGGVALIVIREFRVPPDARV